MVKKKGWIGIGVFTKDSLVKYNFKWSHLMNGACITSNGFVSNNNSHWQNGHQFDNFGFGDGHDI